MNALNIVFRSEDLTSGFALWSSARSISRSSVEAAEEYLMWRVIFAEKLGYDRTIDNDIFLILSTPKPPYLTALQRYVAIQDNRVVRNVDADSVSQLYKWYYTDAARIHDLWPLLSTHEMHALANLPSLGFAGDKLSLLDEIIYENNTSAKRIYNFSEVEGRAAFLKWRRSVSFSECAPWFPVEDLTLDQLSANDSQKPAPRRLISPILGINLIGFADTILGLGEDLSSLLVASRHAGVRTQVVNIPIDRAIGSPNPNAVTQAAVSPLFSINLFCVPLFETERYRLRHPEHILRADYNIGHWPWELSTLPAYWKQAFRFVDEIWAISPYNQEVYRRFTEKPVQYIPPLVQVDEVAPFSLAEIGLSHENFVFLSICDLNSFILRKNPLGAIKAFKDAFPSINANEHLIVKTLNGHSNESELASILKAVGGDQRITVIDGCFSRPKILGLIRAVDCLVSLHRAEGFGRVLAEALLLDTPVIATDYSGSQVFLDETTGFPVEYDIVSVAHNDYCYAEGSVWAEPRLEHAALQMQLVASRGFEVEKRTAAGRWRVQKNHGLPIVVAHMREQFKKIVSRGTRV